MAESSCSFKIPPAIVPTLRLVGKKLSDTGAIVFKDNTEETVSTVRTCNTATHKRLEVLNAFGVVHLKVQAQNATFHARCDGYNYSAENFAYREKVFTSSNNKVNPRHTNVDVSISNRKYALSAGVIGLSEGAHVKIIKDVVALINEAYEKLGEESMDAALRKEVVAAVLDITLGQVSMGAAVQEDVVALLNEKWGQPLQKKDAKLFVPVAHGICATLEQEKYDAVEKFLFPKGSTFGKKDEQSNWWKKITEHEHVDIKIHGSWSGMNFKIYMPMLPEVSITIAEVRPQGANEFTVDIFGDVDPLFVISLIAAIAVMKSPGRLDLAGFGKKLLCVAGVAGIKEGVDCLF